MNTGLLHQTLRQLAPHVDGERIGLTGGVAIGLHIYALSDDPSRCLTAGDIDFVARDVDAIRPTVANDFLVSHFHLPQPFDPKFLIQLVDPATRLRLDIFPDALGALDRAVEISVGGIVVKVLRAHDLLDHKLTLLSRASRSSPIDEKHYVDAKRLAGMCGRDAPAIATSQLASTIYARDLGATCIRCEASERSAFPLAPKRAIFDVLGYV